MADKTAENERIYTIPLREVKTSPRNHRSDRAIRYIKAYLSKHMKSEDIWIDASVNEFIWARGMYEVPRRIRVRARRFEDGVVEVSLPEAEHKASIREEIKKRKEKAEEKKEKGEEKKEKAKEKKEEGSPAKKEGEKPATKEGEAEKKEQASPPEGGVEKSKAASKTPAPEKPEKAAPKAAGPTEEKASPPAKPAAGGKEKTA